LSRIRSLLKKTAPERSPLNINQVIQETLALISGVLEKQHVSVMVELVPTPPRVLGDRVKPQQVPLNLTMNGIKAMYTIVDRPRVLMIRSDAVESRLEVAVHDWGPGLDPQYLPHLFNTFVTTKTSGMGMGLSIRRSIIEAHGGRLRASPNRL
jgi:C4-dicarboxylate-specific signal transduction histidine kinase